MGITTEVSAVESVINERLRWIAYRLEQLLARKVAAEAGAAEAADEIAELTAETDELQAHLGNLDLVVERTATDDDAVDGFNEQIGLCSTPKGLA